MKKIIKLLGKFFPNQKNNNDNSSKINTLAEDTLKTDSIFLFDFLNFKITLEGNSPNIIFKPSNGDYEDGSYETVEPIKIKIKPIDVFNELEKVPLPFDNLFVNEKISVLKDKAELINQTYAKREVNAMIERLTNRKKYNAFKHFFENFPNTTDEKIKNLLGKYELCFEKADLFIPEFPDDAVKIMKSYSENCNKICNKKPIFYVIAEPNMFKEAYKTRDPILLVQSPFGFYWQILGAWDKELILLSEL